MEVLRTGSCKPICHTCKRILKLDEKREARLIYKMKKNNLAQCSLCKNGFEIKMCSLCGKPVCSEHSETSAIGNCWCIDCIESTKEKDFGYLPMF